MMSLHAVVVAVDTVRAHGVDKTAGQPAARFPASLFILMHQTLGREM